MSQEYKLSQKCPACGSRQESTLKAIKAQRAFECQCCGLVVALRTPQVAEPKRKERMEEEALAV